MKRIILLLIMVVLALGAFAQEEDVFVKEYKIGPKDLLEITVFELPELNQTVRVSEDGSISDRKSVV
jgi:polysaccharide biosynthesis/export protein